MNRLHRIVGRIAFVLFTMSGINIANAKDATVPTLRIGTGLPGGVYFQLTQELVELSGTSGYSLRAVAGEGSWQSLQRLRNEECEFAISQWDALLKYRDQYQDSSIIAVRPLFTEYLHIIIREPLEILNEEELKGKRIFVGPENSGTAITALTLFDALGISQSEYAQVAVDSLTEVLELLRTGQIDVAMYVGPLGAEFIDNLLRSSQCRLFSLSASAKKRLSLDVSGSNRMRFDIADISPSTYWNQTNSVTTVSVPAVFVARANVPSAIIETFDSLLSSAMDQISSQTTGITFRPPAKGLYRKSAIPLHDEDNFPQNQTTLTYAINILSALAMVALIWFLLRRYAIRLMRFNRRRTLMLGAGIVLLVGSVCAIGIYTAERHVNQHFESIYETGWSMLIYLTSGLSDRAPITTSGRLLGALLLVAGPAFLAVITGLIASRMVIKTMERKMAKNLKDHYVILNWGQRTLQIIRQIHAPDVQDERRSVIIVMSDDPQLNLERLDNQFNNPEGRSQFEDVFFYPGDPTDQQCLTNANITDARSVLIMADDNHPSPDEKTLRSIFQIKKVAEAQNSHVHVIAELLNIENTGLVESISAGFPGTVDSVASGQMRTLLLAQATLMPGLTKFYKDLLYVGSDTNELYSVQVPESVDGMTFPQYAAQFFNGHRNDPMIPVGIIRGRAGDYKIGTNPKPQTEDGQPNPLYTLQKGDRLLVISYNAPRTAPEPA